jgi:hypothetical protein
VETLDSQRKKMVVSANQRISVLDEISVYTTNSEGSTPLIDVFRVFHKEYGMEEAMDNDATNAEYLSFFKSILPDYDPDRVYASDIKKIIRWYYILLKEAPQLITGSTATDEEE